MGARPLERGLVREIEEPMSLLLLEDKIKPGDNVIVDLDEENNKLTFSVIEEALAE
jgi:ATP-dependent Clp protease ATP-binding subunit ClpA